MLREDWSETYINFIQDQRLPTRMYTKCAVAARVMRRSKGFVLVDNKLYRRGARSGVLMKCITGEDGYDKLRQPCSFKNASQESIQSWFLVAHHSVRC
jgi:hypothetical protein